MLTLTITYARVLVTIWLSEDCFDFPLGMVERVTDYLVGNHHALVLQDFWDRVVAWKSMNAVLDPA